MSELIGFCLVIVSKFTSVCSLKANVYFLLGSTDVARGIRLPGDVLGLLQPVRGERDGQEGVSRLSVGGSRRARRKNDVSEKLVIVCSVV